MSLTPRQERYLAKITQLVEAIQTEAKKAEGNAGKASGKGRKRRSAAEAAKMKKTILAERAKGTSAAKLAAKYGVSTAYIYMIKE
jgi:imidazolonepropionase-like amidohydrolase